jgi:hypothetical protein
MDLGKYSIILWMRNGRSWLRFVPNSGFGLIDIERSDSLVVTIIINSRLCGTDTLDG